MLSAALESIAFLTGVIARIPNPAAVITMPAPVRNERAASPLGIVWKPRMLMNFSEFEQNASSTVAEIHFKIAIVVACLVLPILYFAKKSSPFVKALIASAKKATLRKMPSAWANILSTQRFMVSRVSSLTAHAKATGAKYAVIAKLKYLSTYVTHALIVVAASPEAMITVKI